MNKKYEFTKSKLFHYLGSGTLSIVNIKPFVLVGSLLIFGLTLFTNQYFHGGVLGTLHNKSVKPKLEISNIRTNNKELIFQIYRTEGADVYGSFLIGIQILNENNQVVKSWSIEELSNFKKEKINNRYVTKVKPGKHSLVIPLGAKADIMLDINGIKMDKNYRLKLIDISGLEWEMKIP